MYLIDELEEFQNNTSEQLLNILNDVALLKQANTNVYTKTESDNKYQNKGNYLTEHQSLDDYATKDGTCVRDYINIEDLINAHLLALEYLNNGGETNYFNLGTNDGNTVKEVFNACEKITNQTIAVKQMPRREGDPASLVADNKKIKSTLGWSPEKNLEYSIETAYKWEKILQS